MILPVTKRLTPPNRAAACAEAEGGSSRGARAEHLHRTVPPLLPIQPLPPGLVGLAEGVEAGEPIESPCPERGSSNWHRMSRSWLCQPSFYGWREIQFKGSSTWVASGRAACLTSPQLPVLAASRGSCLVEGFNEVLPWRRDPLPPRRGSSRCQLMSVTTPSLILLLLIGLLCYPRGWFGN